MRFFRTKEQDKTVVHFERKFVNTTTIYVSFVILNSASVLSFSIYTQDTPAPCDNGQSTSGIFVRKSRMTTIIGGKSMVWLMQWVFKYWKIWSAKPKWFKRKF